MAKLSTLFGFRDPRNRWENPRNSIGIKGGSIGKGKYSCWHAKGPVGEAWKRISPEIKAFIEEECQKGPGLTFGIYMIGRTEDKAKPTILLCSTDVEARREVRKKIEKSGIMENGAMKDYPPILLGDTSKFPDSLAQEDVKSILLLESKREIETPVFSTREKQAFGRRLFIPTQNSHMMRLASGGPILYVNQKVYQLTVGHAFLELDGIIPQESSSSDLDDCDFDGMSESEDDDPEPSPEVANKSSFFFKNSRLLFKQSPMGNVKSTPQQAASDINLQIDPSAASQHSRDSGVDLSTKPDTISHNQPQTMKATIPRELDRIGTLALRSETGNKQPFDYALIELQGKHQDGRNEVPCVENGSQRLLQVRQAANIAPEEVNIVTMTASSKFMSGKLCATASYMRGLNQKAFQEVYPVYLDGALHDGDCGSGVIDLALGHFYGHIVAGCRGTRVAYIAPALQVFDAIMEVLGGDAKKYLTPLNYHWKGRNRVDPLRVVEFASPKYFSELQENVTGAEDGVPAKSGDLVSASVVSAIDRQSVDRQLLLSRDATQRPSDKPLKNSRFKPLPLKPKRRPFKPEGKWNLEDIRASSEPHSRTMEAHGPQAATEVATNRTLEQLFFALPSDLQVQVIASLSIPDILTVRLASRTWNQLIILNEAPISRAFLEYNPVPRFALSLYPPPPDPATINLYYICGLWHRLSIASKLASLMAQWITKDLFLQRSVAERLKFLPQQVRLRRRLVPILFTILHFFEGYRQALLKDPQILLRDTSKIDIIEAKIMEKYDNKTLLQVHQVFPLFVSCLCRMLRPPSYLGRLEKSVRGYGIKPPADRVVAAILCVGGLGNVLRLSEIETYERRVVVLEEWYASVSLGEIETRLIQPKKTPSTHVPINEITASPENTSSALKDAPQASSPTSSNANTTPLLNTSSLTLSEPLSSTLSLETTQTLLSSLPSLKSLWLQTAEAILLQRGAVERKQDIKKNAQLLAELVCEGLTDADELSSERAGDFVREGDGVVRGTVEEMVYFGSGGMVWW